MNQSSLESSHPVRSIRGILSDVPSDKSISHRACMLAGLAAGETTIRFAGGTHKKSHQDIGMPSGMPSGILGDVLATIRAMEAMGALVHCVSDDCVKITGVGKNGLQSPVQAIDLGNSGTSTRLLMGIIGSYPVRATLTGDDSLSNRPMKRAMLPLDKMGVAFHARSNNYLPMDIIGKENLQAIAYTLPVPSAQVKTAILLAALRAEGTTKIVEPVITRDHTEKILTAFGYPVLVEKQPNGGKVISVEGGGRLRAAEDMIVPADFSSAAFVIVAALITPDSEITLEHIGVNPTRTGLLDCLLEMGGDISLLNPRKIGGEDVADIRVRSSALHGIRVPESRVSLMIDEFPILAVAATFAKGSTHFSGLEELRVKESDRLMTTYDMLLKAGASILVDDIHHRLTIEGSSLPPVGGGIVKAGLDHRIAMSTLVLGMACENPMSINASDPPAYQSSFPAFDRLMNSVGGNIQKN